MMRAREPEAISSASGSSTVDATSVDRMSRSRTNQRCISASASGTAPYANTPERQQQRDEKAQ